MGKYVDTTYYVLAINQMLNLFQVLVRQTEQLYREES